MSKKNSNVENLKKLFENNLRFSNTYKIFKKNLEPIKKKNFIVAVSGGADSLALAAICKKYELVEKKINFLYVLIDHKIRKISTQEAFEVKKLLKKKNITLTIITNKEKISQNFQSQARKIRYKLLSDFSKKKNISNILTAHHSDDQIETFLIRLSRGSGVQGLSSMRIYTNLEKLKLIRPLLDVKKLDLKYIANKVFGKIFQDPSNKNSKYLRTRVRSLKKVLEKSGVKHDQILKSIKNLASTSETLNIYIEKITKKNIEIKKNEILINFKNILLESEEIQLKIISNQIKNLSKSYYPPRSIKVKNLIQNLQSGKQKKFTLSKCTIEKVKNYLLVKKEQKIIKK